jgi:Fur family zinc uptake transcriptional regulator
MLRAKSHAGTAAAEHDAGCTRTSDDAGLTPARRAVLDLLAGAERPLSAYAIAEQLSATRERAVAPVAVYRSLRFLIGRGLVVRLESLNAFICCAHPDVDHDCVFLLCQRCGQAIEIIDHRLRRRLDDDASAEKFLPARRIIEVQGLCRDCRPRMRTRS